MPDDANAPAPSTAPTDAPAPSTNPEPAAPAPTPAPATPDPAQIAAEYLGTSVEGLQGIKSYYDNNGGPEKAMANMKRIMANRQPAPQPQPTVTPLANNPNNVTPMTNEPMAPMPQPAIEGGFTMQELALQNYFEKLSQREEYASISQEIANGDVLKQLKEWGIPILVGDQVNAAGINRYLGLYAKSKPAPAPANPVTTTPLAEPIQTASGSVTNMNEAVAILAQDRDFRSKGQPGHPLAEQANKFFDDTLSAQANRGKRVKK